MVTVGVGGRTDPVVDTDVGGTELEERNLTVVVVVAVFESGQPACARMASPRVVGKLQIS